jgi:Anti-sigma factor NepR
MGQTGRYASMTKQSTGAVGAKARRNGSKDPLGANSEIGRKLKQYYDELVSDEVPDRFAELLSQLENAEPTQKRKKA